MNLVMVELLICMDDCSCGNPMSSRDVKGNYFMDSEVKGRAFSLNDRRNKILNDVGEGEDGVIGLQYRIVFS